MTHLIGWPLLWIGTLFGAMIFGYIYGRERVQAEWASEKAATVTAQRTKENELQAGMDKLRTEKNRELARLNNTVQRLSSSLRDRPERPAVPSSANAGDGGGWCSGPQLYREDAAMVIAEAERADKIRLALIQCQDAYRAAQH